MKRISALLIILAGTLWGTMGLFIRELEQKGLSSMDIVTIRAVFTSILMLVFLALYDKKLLKIRWKDLWCFIGTGLLSIVFFNYCYFNAITMVSLSLAAVLLYTAPIIVMLLSVVLFKEKFTALKLLAMILSFGGCILVTGVIGDFKYSIPGILTGLGAGFGYALYSIFGRYAIAKGYHPFTITAYTFIVASATALPLTEYSRLLEVGTDSGFIIFGFVFTLITTVLPFLFYTMGLRYIESGKASVMASIEPVVATLLGILVFEESISVYGMLGVSFVIISVIILTV